MIANTVLAIIVAYLLGSIPTGYLITRQTRGVDIREIGHHYSGAKNVYMEVGRVAGAATAIGDIAKGALAILQTKFVEVPDAALVLIGLAVIAGHVWPIFLQFRGGAGFATALGVTFAALPRESLLLLLPYLVLLMTAGRRFGLGVSSAPLLIPLVLLSWWLGEPPALIVLPLILGILVGAKVYWHELGEIVRSFFGRGVA